MRKKSDIATRIAAALALALALSACSTPPTPNPEPTSSGTGSTSGTPTSAPPPATSAVPTASTPPAPDTAYQPATPTSPAKNVPKPVMPALAKEKSEAGQKAFIKYWLATYNYMRESEDISLFRSVCAPTSKFCTGSEENLQEIQNEGAWRDGGAVTATAISAPSKGFARNSWKLQLTELPSAFYSKSGPASKFPGSKSVSKYEALITLSWANSSWRTTELGQL